MRQVPSADGLRLRLNVGCGDHPLEGWLNVDLVGPADFIGDARQMTCSDVDEIRCDHMLEHLPRADTQPLLDRFHSWLKPGGRLTVEVPNMAEIMRRGAKDPWWDQYIYGAQNHDGEFHRSGFVTGTLTAGLWAAGFKDVQVEAFLSSLAWRDGMPCLRAEGVA